MDQNEGRKLITENPNSPNGGPCIALIVQNSPNHPLRPTFTGAIISDAIAKRQFPYVVSETDYEPRDLTAGWHTMLGRSLIRGLFYCDRDGGGDGT